MNANKVAAALQRNGLSVTKIEQGSDVVDGAVVITALVHVQVPTYGNTLCVVVESADGQAFDFYPERKAIDIAGIVADVRSACGMIACEA